jgi:hypothetical protein
MGVFRSTVFWGGGAALMTLLGLWKRVWVVGAIAGFWIVFSLKYLIRGVARRRS